MIVGLLSVEDRILLQAIYHIVSLWVDNMRSTYPRTSKPNL